MPIRAEVSERRARAKTEAVRRVAAGESVTAMCAGPDMPNRTTLGRWARADAGFAAALAEAYQRAAWRRGSGFDDAKAREFLARFAAGETLAALCRDPAMPSRKRLAYWRATQGEFGGEIFWLIRSRKAELSRLAAHNAPRQWDEATADKILLHVGRGHSLRRLRRIDPSLPGADAIDRWRRERPEFDHEVKVNQAMGCYRLAMRTRMAAALDTLRDGIIQGGSIQSLGGKHGLPCRATLYTWVRRSPEFAREIAQACDYREDWYTDQLQEIAEEAAGLGVVEVRRRMSPLVRQLGRLWQRPGMRGRG